ncbi:MAG: hypothetical protein ABSF26_11960 [Thermoguttaceae bacterium]|jgi:hypothetical protein
MSRRKTAPADPHLGLAAASGSAWREKDYREASGRSNGLSPNGRVCAWGRRYPWESPWDGG